MAHARGNNCPPMVSRGAARSRSLARRREMGLWRQEENDGQHYENGSADRSAFARSAPPRRCIVPDPAHNGIVSWHHDRNNIVTGDIARPASDGNEGKGDCRMMTHIADAATCRFALAEKRARTTNQPSESGPLATRGPRLRRLGGDASSMRMSSGRWEGKTAPPHISGITSAYRTRPPGYPCSQDNRNRPTSLLARSSNANRARRGREAATKSSTDRRPVATRGSRYLWGR